MAKRKQYVELELHPSIADYNFGLIRADQPKLVEVLSAYATALSTVSIPTTPIYIVDVNHRYGGTHLDFTLGTSEGFRILKITYEVNDKKYYVAVHNDLFGYVTTTMIRSDNHSYVMGQASKLATQLRRGSNANKLAEYTLDLLRAHPNHADKLMHHLRYATECKLKEGLDTYNLRYTFSESQLEQLAMYAFDREAQPTIDHSIRAIYEQWRNGEDRTKQVKKDIDALLNKPKWVVVVQNRPDEPDATLSEYYIGLMDGEKVLRPFQLYKSFAKLPDDVRNELMVSLTMAKVYSDGQGIELGHNYIPLHSPMYRNSQVVYKDIGYVHRGDHAYSIIAVDKL